MSDIQKLRFYTDESGTPYEDGENPFPRTKEDDEFDQMMIKKYNLVLKEDEDKKWPNKKPRLNSLFELRRGISITSYFAYNGGINWFAWSCESVNYFV